MDNLILNIKDYLSGKKAYIVGCLMMILGFLQGDTQMIFEGLGIVTLRAGIAKL